MIDLKPCPFCGGPARGPENTTPTKRPRWVITCHLFCCSRAASTKRDVIRYWNERDETDQLRTLLKDCFDMKIFGHGLRDLHESSPLVKRIEEALKQGEK